MARPAVVITASPEETLRLEDLANDHQELRGQALRARVVLEALAGKTNEEIAATLDVSLVTVRRWRARFAQQGLEGLKDRPRPGKPRTYQDDFRQKVLETLELPPPEGQTSWDGASIATHLNASPDAVWRLLRKEGLSLQRQRSWLISTDLDFAPKRGDLIGLYLNPPLNALVISTGERLSAPVGNTKVGYIQTDSGKIVEGFRSAQKQEGNLHLLAALQVAGRGIYAATTERKRQEDFKNYLDDLIEDLPLTEQLDIVFTTGEAAQLFSEWLTGYGENVRFHSVGSSSSWLAVIEIFFSLFAPQTLDAELQNTSKLRSLVEEFLISQNARAKPFRWQKRSRETGKQGVKVINLCN